MYKVASTRCLCSLGSGFGPLSWEKGYLDSFYYNWFVPTIIVVTCTINCVAAATVNLRVKAAPMINKTQAVLAKEVVAIAYGYFSLSLAY